MGAPRLSADTRDVILAAYVAGTPIAEIAADFGVSQSYPVLLAKRRGFVPRRKIKSFTPRPSKLSAPQQAELLRRYQAGELVKTIAADLGIGADWVSKRANAAGLRRHPNHKRPA